MKIFHAAALPFLMAGLAGPHTAVAQAGPPVRLVLVAQGFDSPVHLSAPPGDGRLFVVEQAGIIKLVKNGAVQSAPFLDLRSKVKSGGEQGLLSIAFHPDYAKNGCFFVDYTDLKGNTKVERYRVSRNPDVADPGTAKLIIAIDQPYANHNGGQLAFGPDNMLYVGMGDGGSGGDPHGNGQNRRALLGKLLRLDVDHGDPYAVPADNPFAGSDAARGEVFAYGLRNPWRFSFDRASGLLYIADVGQNKWEEIDVQPAARKGLNYGWNIMEGNHCYEPSDCSAAGLTRPLIEYGHSDGCSVIGGFVYRGSRMPAWKGTYFYADYCQQWLRSFKYLNGQATEQRSWPQNRIGNVQSFGEDGAGEIYVLTSIGNVYRIEN